MIVGGIFAVATFIASWLAQFTGLVAVQLIALGAGFVCFVDAALGFGDLGPVSAEARVFATLEAVLGQIFLTILVARLVGLHLADQRGEVA